MIRTVLGDIEKSEIKNALIHEHIQCVSNDMLSAFGKRWLDEEKLEKHSISILTSLKNETGINLFVDGTSIDLGRNVRLLKSVSEASGVHIVASTGLYYYPSMLTCQRSADELSELFIYECEFGIEATDIKPGILKCAGEGSSLTPDMSKRIKALSIVQSKTGVPMYAHCSHENSIVYEMMKIFEKSGVNPEKTILGHASRRLDTEYLKSILKEGYYISVDQSFDGDETEVAKVVYKLSENGYEDKLLFSQDHPIYNDFENSARTGLNDTEENHITRYSYIQNKLVPAFLKIGISREQCNKFLRENALRVLDLGGRYVKSKYI